MEHPSLQRARVDKESQVDPWCCQPHVAPTLTFLATGTRFAVRSRLCITLDLTEMVKHAASLQGGAHNQHLHDGLRALAESRPVIGQPVTTECHGTDSHDGAFRSVTPHNARIGGQPPNTPLGPISITLRSTLDPLIVAHNMTAGSLHFGRSHSDELKAAVVLGALGLCFMVPTIAFIIFQIGRRLVGVKSAKFSQVSDRNGRMSGSAAVAHGVPEAMTVALPEPE